MFHIVFPPLQCTSCNKKNKYRAKGVIIEIRGPWALTFCVRTNLAMGQSSKICTYTLFLSQDVEIEHIFTVWAAVSEIMADFQNCHIWPWNLTIGQNSRSCTYILFVVTQRVEIEIILTHYGPFFKIVPYLGMKLGKWPKFRKLHI